MDKLAYRVGEAAELVGVSRSLAYQWIAEGLLPHVRIGHSLRVPAEALRQLINERATSTKGDEAK